MAGTGGAGRLVVLDWDDTCCPSSWIASSEESQYDHPDNLSLLRSIEEGMSALLRAIDASGCSIVIITNADQEWVRFSATRFLPRVLPLLERVSVVSARHYEGIYPGRSVCWKAAAFTQVAKQFFAALPGSGLGQRREIISIGDSNDERLAVRAAATPLQAMPKAIKLVDAPTLSTVAAQLHTITTVVPLLVLAEYPVDVDVAAILEHTGASSQAAAHIQISDRNYNFAHPDGLQAQAPRVQGAGPTSLEAAQRQAHQVASLQEKLWEETAWGILTVIRFQAIDATQNALADAAAANTAAPVAAPVLVEA